MARLRAPNLWMSNRLRLDELLVARGLYLSRSRARDAVLRGTVKVSGEIAAKPACLVDHDIAVSVSDEARPYVSRAALKLIHGLDTFSIAIEGRHCLDIGASTGGFTQVLLERGAAHVTAIDVGHGQLEPEIANDSRVTSIEGLNARDLRPEHLRGAIDLIVCDVSFISLKLAVPPALALAGEGAELVALIKPQFEVGRAAVGKGGIVGDPVEHKRVCREIEEYLLGEGWEVLGVTRSPVEGGDGNREFLIAARKPS